MTPPSFDAAAQPAAVEQHVETGGAQPGSLQLSQQRVCNKCHGPVVEMNLNVVCRFQHAPNNVCIDAVRGMQAAQHPYKKNIVPGISLSGSQAI